ncbi:MAG: ABC transporter ATP-binding protein [Oscillospiraceae bacterium]|nr:ABC transporter ATP-binding protein [Oscillospiraceae bacterium]
MLELNDVSVRFGEKTVLSGCSLSVAAGERIALMGPSGCGKTTLLRVALSLQLPSSGTVRTSSKRNAAVFQEPRLLPWRTAAENVNAVLSDSPGTLPEAVRWLERLELREAADLYPAELSGGMQQRVSIARALCCSPDLLVLDEPFKGLDTALHDRVLALVNAALPADTAVLLATHSEEEAKALGCRILRWSEGCFV